MTEERKHEIECMTESQLKAALEQVKKEMRKFFLRDKRRYELRKY